MNFRAVDRDRPLDLGVSGNRDGRVERQPFLFAPDHDVSAAGGDVAESNFHAVQRLAEIKGGRRYVDILRRQLADPETAAGHVFARRRVSAHHGAAEQQLAVFHHGAGSVVGGHGQLGGMDHRGPENGIDDLEGVERNKLSVVVLGTTAHDVDHPVVAHYRRVADRYLQFQLAVHHPEGVGRGLKNADLG